VLIKGFGLSIDEARPILADWNRSCKPPWSPRELDHKLRSADQAQDDRPRGYLVSEPNTVDRPASARSGVINHKLPAAQRPDCTLGLNTDSEDTFRPHQLAMRFIEERGTQPDGISLRYWQGEFHRWDGASYRIVAHAEFRAELSRFLAELFGRLQRQAAARLEQDDTSQSRSRKRQREQESGGVRRRLVRARGVSTRLVSDVAEAVASLVLVRTADCPAQPAWLDGWPAGFAALTKLGDREKPGNSDQSLAPPWPASEILPAPNALVHLPTFVDQLDPARSIAGSGTASADWSVAPTPRFFHPLVLGYPFDSSAPPPNSWLAFLNQIWGTDVESIACLQEWFGYLITSETHYQKILMMVGPKRSGRGTIARVLKALAGSGNVVNPTLATLARPFGLSALIGRPIAIFPDARLSARPDNAAIVECLLSISGEDDQTIDRKHLPAWTGSLPTRFVLISNELPKLRDASGALASRLIILRFTRSFFGEEDTGLMDRLLEELPGILLWALEGWARLRRRGRFEQPSSAMELVATMDDLASPITAFLRDCCKISPDASVPVSELYRAWRDWCESVGRDVKGDEHSFGRDLHAAIPGLSRSRPRIGEAPGGRLSLYRGLRLLSPAEARLGTEPDLDSSPDPELEAFDTLPF
jgi:putative DNA primase/helicase